LSENKSLLSRCEFCSAIISRGLVSFGDHLRRTPECLRKALMTHDKVSRSRYKKILRMSAFKEELRLYARLQQQAAAKAELRNGK
jgi:hypothetical protein